MDTMKEILAQTAEYSSKGNRATRRVIVWRWVMLVFSALWAIAFVTDILVHGDQAAPALIFAASGALSYLGYQNARTDRLELAVDVLLSSDMLLAMAVALHSHPEGEA